MRTLFRLLRRVLNWFLRINPKHTVAMLPVNFLRFFKRPPKKSPPPTNQTDVYYDGDADEMVRQDADGTTQTLGTSAAKWGNISGTLTDQTDLQAALDAKLAASGVSAFGATLIDDTDAAAARTTLGLDSWLANNGISHDPTITSPSAVGAGTLSSLATADEPVGRIQVVPVSSSSIYVYQLTSSTAATDNEYRVRPADYAASTNEKVWFLLGRLSANGIQVFNPANGNYVQLTTSNLTSDKAHALPNASAEAVIALTSQTDGSITEADLTLGAYADDAAAATGGVAVGDIYRKTDGTVVWRQS